MRWRLRFRRWRRLVGSDWQIGRLGNGRSRFTPAPTAFLPRGAAARGGRARRSVLQHAKIARVRDWPLGFVQRWPSPRCHRLLPITTFAVAY